MSFLGSVAKTVAVHIVADYVTEPAKRILDITVKKTNLLYKHLTKEAKPKNNKPQTTRALFPPAPEEEEGEAMKAMKDMRKLQRHKSKKI